MQTLTKGQRKGHERQGQHQACRSCQLVLATLNTQSHLEKLFPCAPNGSDTPQIISWQDQTPVSGRTMTNLQEQL